MVKANTDKIIKEVKAAAKAYYQGSEPVMTDEQYDTKVEYLESLVENGELELTSELKEILYDSVSAGSTPSGTTVIHDYPMLSLGKAKNAEELSTYHDRLVKAGATGFILQMKLDGMALSAKYENGKLTQLATRGDGEKGELLNYLIDNKYITIKGLPKTTGVEENFELRGELYMTDSQFEVINDAREKATGERFSNSRNATTGIVRRAERSMDYNATLTFSAYSVYKKGKQVDFSKVLDKCDKIISVDMVTKEEVDDSTGDFSSVCKVDTTDFGDLVIAVSSFGELRDGFNTPTDGVVIRPKNDIEMLNKLGFTSHHPVAYVAYKYPGTKEITTVTNITVTVGKTGKLTPQAKVKPVKVDGVEISNITCHNYSWLNKMDIRVGSTVAVTRANDVIPAISTVVEVGENSKIEAPTVCPECGSVLNNNGEKYPKTLVCENLDCPSRLLHYMKSIVGRNYLYIDGLGDVALTALVNQNKLKTVSDLFRLTERELAKTPIGTTSNGNTRLLGPGNATNVMISINKAKNKTSSNKLLASLNLDGVGVSTAERLIKHFGGIEEVLNVDPKRLLEVNQVGETLVGVFEKYQERARQQLEELMALGVIINDPKKSEEVKGAFSVSGSVDGFANRSEFVEYLKEKGWEFHKSPKKSTDVLFADPTSTSSKVRKAKENGTRIIKSLEDL